MTNFESLQRKLIVQEADHYENSDSIADSTLSPLSYEAQNLLQKNRLTEPESFAKDFAEILKRLAISTGAGVVADVGLCMSGLERIPKIGTPLALATPFLAAGLANSYQRSNTFFDKTGLAEGMLAYGAVYGIGRIFSVAEAHCYRPPRASQVIPIPRELSIRR